MNKNTREGMLYVGWIIQKLGDLLDHGNEKDAGQINRLKMAYNGARAYFDNAVKRMNEDEKLKLKTDMERKFIQIDYKKSLDFAYRKTQALVDIDELCTLAGYSIDYACAYCDRDADEQRNCMLRETLIRCNAVQGIDLSRRDRCPYHGMQAQEIVAAADRRLHDKWRKANK